MGYHGGYDAGYRMAFPRASNTIRALIVANVVVFVLQHLLESFARIDLSSVFGVRADRVLGNLWLWQVVTYMFLHGGMFHILFNMMAVYFFGTQLDRMLGRRRFLTLYFGGGIAGGVAYCATQYLAERMVPAIGASAAVMAILVVCALHFPHQVVFFFFVPVPLRWLAIVLVGVDLLYSIGPRFTGVAHTAHLGGAFFGFMFWRFGPALGQYFGRMTDRRKERDAQRVADADQRMDDLLAKISREGFGSLSRRERDFLTEQSKRRRDRGYRG